MARRKENVRVCDVCKKRVSDEGEIHYGGHPHQGWFGVHETGGSTQLSELHRQKNWDACSAECLQKLVIQITVKPPPQQSQP